MVIELKVDHVMKCLVQQNNERNIRLNHRTYSVGMQIKDVPIAKGVLVMTLNGLRFQEGGKFTIFL